MGWRWRIFGGRLWFFIKRWPFRLLSLLQWLTLIHSPQGRHRLMRWLSGVVLLATDLLPLALIYSTLLDLMKRKSRPLSIDELEVARKVFGSAIALHLITLDAHSRPIRKGMGTAYVSFLPSTIGIHFLRISSSMSWFTFGNMTDMAVSISVKLYGRNVGVEDMIMGDWTHCSCTVMVPDLKRSISNSRRIS